MTNPDDQVSALEKAILARARSLADEHMKQAKRARERIMEDSAERLRLQEEKEILVGKAKADREYRRRVQASEIRMQAELDRLRWGLVQSVLDHLKHRLTEITSDEAQYLPLFKRLLAEAASSIEREELVALVGDGDHRRFRGQWETIAKGAVPGKKVELSSEICACSGGVLLKSKDERISVDNTFEGRLDRMEGELHRVILERLFPNA
jgi:V/A-type H+-transporting ATPase subunit E